jgi:hypothetical protein
MTIGKAEADAVELRRFLARSNAWRAWADAAAAGPARPRPGPSVGTFVPRTARPSTHRSVKGIVSKPY